MANLGLIISVIFFLIATVYSQGWPNPKFSNPNTVGIELESSAAGARIRMEEELTRPIRLAIINYSGSGTPEIEGFTVGTAQNLNLTFEKTGNQWEILILNRQDYENPSQRAYFFTIRIANDNTVSDIGSINLLTINIFDNDPSITYEGPCTALELEENYNTQCDFKVYDADGLLNNEIRLEIEGSNNEANLFDFRDQIQIDDYNTQFTLYVKTELRYEERAVYNFKTFVYNIANKTGSVTTIVEIIDVPSLDPVWVKPFATARFDEKTEQIFEVKAIDGDTGLNVPICYKLLFEPDEDYSEFISIDQNSGSILISPINRDALKQEVFPFTAVAYKCYNDTWAIYGDAVIIVDDINDNWPEITLLPEVLRIKEATSLTLPFEDFIINDIDLGIHATYVVELYGENALATPINYAEPFNVIPDKGYQESNFMMTVTNATLLDFEDDDWRTFKIKVIATEEDILHVREMEFTIELINWNDEFPIFSESEYVVSVYENVTEFISLANVTATDRDIGDRVIHTIVGRHDLNITENGEILTKMNDTFDYERQTSVLLQIKATDTLQTYEGEKLNSAFAQLTINILDVNDETPEIRMPRTAPSIMENSPSGTIITDGIIVTDPDTTADIEFKINWDLSYATKSGQEADKIFYENCFIIEADKTDPNRVLGSLKINPDFFEKKIDYEEYEVIYLSISATDLNQEINEDTAEGVLTIRIEDENDNAPEFILDTLLTYRSVIEEALSGSLIGTIFAIDIDGPGNNIITYSISPEEGTPSDLLEINPQNGAITVREGAVVGCDIPVIHNLTYLINISDGELSDEGIIQIKIIDINNKVPFFDEFDTNISLYENITSGEIIQYVKALDDDRDEPNNLVHYMINYLQFPKLRTYFEIDEIGTLRVRLEGDAVLDRDHGEPEHDIYINIEDNYLANSRNSNNTMVKLILLDVNDNAPEMPSIQSFSPSISENSDIGTKIGPTFYAPDIDDDTTPNAWVGYRILSIRAGSNTTEPPPNPEELFSIRSYDNKYGDLLVNKVLKGYYGKWFVKIEAFDHGDEWTSQVQLSSVEEYEINIEPFNFNAPKLISPISGRVYRFSIDKQEIGKPLIMADDSSIPPFLAEDDDGGIYGEVTFEITNVPNGNDINFFEVVKENSKESRLHLYRPIEMRTYQINVRATDGGGRTSDTAINVGLLFIDLTGEPFFSFSVFETDFTENVTGLEEHRTIPEAEDPKNNGVENEEDKFEIYYFIDKSYRPSDAALFKIDKVTRDLSLTSMLDREEIDVHEIRIIATNSFEGAENPKANSMLIVNISVNDVNDNPPNFLSKYYGSGITPTDYIGKELLRVQAEDKDLDDVIRYSILASSPSANGENLDEVLSTAFLIDSASGAITLNFAVLPTMKGSFQFTVQAFDLVDHMDECTVNIYIIADSNRVTFVLLNTKTTIEFEPNKRFIAETLSEHYGYECNIDDILKAEVNGVAQEDVTNIRVHFKHNNEAIEATDILSRSNDIIFITKLKSALLEQSINMMDVTENGDYVDNATNMEALFQILLIVVTAVLSLLSISLIIAYCIKTRNLNRQLKALSATDFGSIDSNLNRREVPTTNFYSVEGSNPVLNNKDMGNGVFDNLSVTSDTSDESDFVGIDNDPTFGKKDSTNIAVINNINRRISPNDEYLTFEDSENKKNSDIGSYKF